MSNTNQHDRHLLLTEEQAKYITELIRAEVIGMDDATSRGCISLLKNIELPQTPKPVEATNRHVEILAEVTGMPTYILKDNEPKILYNDCLTAMQRAVEEAENSLIAKYQDMEVKIEAITFNRDQWVNNWNHLDKLYQAQQSELTTLRTEFERVKKYARHDDECLSNIADMNLAQKYDIVCTCGLQGGGDFNHKSLIE
jgi:hypothetical protein